MAKKDVFQEDKFGVRFFIYNRKKYFVVNDLCGASNKNSIDSIERYLKKDPLLKIFGGNRNDAKVPKFCLSFAQYKVLNKREIKAAIIANSLTALSDVSIAWLNYHKIKVSSNKRKGLLKARDTAEVMYRKVLKRVINSATNHITEKLEIV